MGKAARGGGKKTTLLECGVGTIERGLMTKHKTKNKWGKPSWCVGEVLRRGEEEKKMGRQPPLDRKIPDRR